MANRTRTYWGDGLMVVDIITRYPIPSAGIRWLATIFVLAYEKYEGDSVAERRTTGFKAWVVFVERPCHNDSRYPLGQIFARDIEDFCEVSAADLDIIVSLAPGNTSFVAAFKSQRALLEWVSTVLNEHTAGKLRTGVTTSFAIVILNQIHITLDFVTFIGNLGCVEHFRITICAVLKPPTGAPGVEGVEDTKAKLLLCDRKQVPTTREAAERSPTVLRYEWEPDLPTSPSDYQQFGEAFEGFCRMLADYASTDDGT